MADPFKNKINLELVSEFADTVKNEKPSFDKKDFLKKVFNNDWEGKELKERMRHISVCLNDCLESPFPEAVLILKKIFPSAKGWMRIILPDFVEVYGLDHYAESVKALELFTVDSSSEFAVRPFIIRYPERMIKQMLAWSTNKNHHVRRLSSEGCRPRLPWAMGIPALKKDPAPILPILGNLKNDESEYVRKSVANNLNDISKDHPELVLKIAEEWLGKSKETDWVVKHACRTLLKKGNKQALSLFDVAKEVNINIVGFKLQKPKIKLGGTSEFSFGIELLEKKKHKIRIEYKIDYVNLSGGYSKKIFKISETEMKPGEIKQVTRKLQFKDLTIRKHYPGKHKLTLVINGSEKHSIDFELVK